MLPTLRDEHQPDFVVVNGENAAGGLGITRKTAQEILGLGVDAITLGNHAYRHREVYEYLDNEPRIVRPANFPKGSPGRGHTVVESNGIRLGVINLSGQVFLEGLDAPHVNTVDSRWLLVESHRCADGVHRRIGVA